jgi:hypothetical protein
VTAWPWGIVFILFAAWGICAACTSWARLKRFRKYQPESWLLADSLVEGFMALAFLASAVRQAPHPAIDPDMLRNWILFAWLIAYIPKMIGVFWDYQSIGRIERNIYYNPEGDPNNDRSDRSEQPGRSTGSADQAR